MTARDSLRAGMSGFTSRRTRTGQPPGFVPRTRMASWVAAGCFLLAAGCASPARQHAVGTQYRRTGLDSKTTAALDEFRESVAAFRRKGNIPGCAFALVDDKGLVWAEGFGHARRPESEPASRPTPCFACCRFRKSSRPWRSCMPNRRACCDSTSRSQRISPIFGFAVTMKPNRNSGSRCGTC